MRRIITIGSLWLLTAGLLAAATLAPTQSASAAGAQPAWQLPFENGQTWKANGPHRFEGNGSKPWGSVDFGPSGSNKRVVSVAAGKVYKINCASGSYLGIDHGNGWKSTYYHLTSYQNSLVGKQVTAGTYLGNAGRSTPCGGSAGADHVHLTILKDNGATNIHGFKFGNYTVRDGGGSYLGSWKHTSGSVCTVPSTGFMTCGLKSTTVATKSFSAAPVPAVSDTTPELNQTLTAVPGSWNPAPSFGYQWRRGDANIGGARNSTYKVTAADVGSQLSVVVTGSKSGYHAVTKTSAKTSKVPPSSNGGNRLFNPVSGRCIDVAGSGLEYGAVVHLWDCHGGANQSWRWNASDKTLRIYGTPERCLDVSRTNQAVKGQPISVSTCHGEPNQRWHLNGDGTITTPHGLCVDARGAGTELRTVIQTWDCTGAASQQFLATISGTVSVTGKARVGAVLTAAGGWSRGAILSYQWKSSGTSIRGAIGRTYRARPSERGARLSVTVTGRMVGFADVAVTSTPRLIASGVLTTVKPSVRGKARVGAKLVARPGAWRAGNARARLSYRWYAGGKAIKGATGKSLKVKRKYVGKRIHVRVTGAAPGYTTVRVASRKSKTVSR